jgi:predicted DNA-binding transcriptional regulator AlpA
MSNEALLPMETPDIDPENPDRFIVKGVRDRVGMHPSTIYAEIKAGRFPAPVKLGRSSRWVESEIDNYIAAGIAERNKAA